MLLKRSCANSQLFPFIPSIYNLRRSNSWLTTSNAFCRLNVAVDSWSFLSFVPLIHPGKIKAAPIYELPDVNLSSQDTSGTGRIKIQSLSQTSKGKTNNISWQTNLFGVLNVFQGEFYVVFSFKIIMFQYF